MKIEIICNVKGTGKTTYARRNYSSYVFISNNLMKKIDESNAKQSGYYIIDSVDSIPELIFDNVINFLVNAKCEALLLIFDLSKKELSNCSNFNTIWKCGYIPRDYEYQNFKSDKKNFYNYFIQYYPELDAKSYDDIINITEFNFQAIDRLMLLNQLQVNDKSSIDIRALAAFINETLSSKFKDIPDAEILLKKASIIGEQFFCDALESPTGFALHSASVYLKQMEKMQGYIRRSFNNKSDYEFISHDVYEGILESISHNNRIDWTNTLTSYYKKRYEKNPNTDSKIIILRELNNLYKYTSTDILKRKHTSFMLLYYFRKQDRIFESLKMAEIIINDFKLHLTDTEYSFVCNYQIETFIMIGKYDDALKILETIINYEKYAGSNMIIRYYYALCLYNTGDVDLSYSTANEIIEYLRITSGSNTHEQKLFCLTYSLYATLQNHLNLDDGGARYYKLALNNAKDKLENQKYYYDILKKCDMFFEFKDIVPELEKCLNYYEKNLKFELAGEVCVNLATEMMFQECKNADVIKEYFEKALTYFSKNINERLAYAKNNYAIYKVIVENDIESGRNLFYEALLAGLSDFSYMTIYLNICMCYILLDCADSDEFLDAYYHFNFAQKKLTKREHATQYEKIYKSLLELLIVEHKGESVSKKAEKLISELKETSFFYPILSDMIHRKHSLESASHYKDNNFFYSKINEFHCFFAEFRFWE